MVAARGRHGLVEASETEPGNPAPVDPIPVKMRPVDRKRLPIGGAIIAVSAPVTMGVTPMAWSGFGCSGRRRRLGGFRRQRRTRHARRRRLGLRSRRGLSSGWCGGRLGCGGVLGVAGEGGDDNKQGCDGKAGEMRFHFDHPLRRCHSGMVRRTRSQMCNCTSGNPEIPGSRFVRPGMTFIILSARRRQAPFAE
jgi:hypothetical protein